MSTIISLLIAIGLLASGKEGFESGHMLPLLFLTSGGVFLLLFVLMNALIVIPIQRMEEKLVPRLTELVRSNRFLSIANFTILLFAFFSFLLCIDFGLPKRDVLLVWIIFLGLSLDGLYFLVRHFIAYLNPFNVISQFGLQAKKVIKSSQNVELCSWIDALSEVAIKAIQRQSISLADAAIKELESLALENVKKWGSQLSLGQRSSQNKDEKKAEQIYILSFFLQRFKLIHEKAVNAKLEPVASLLVVAAGKIAVFVAKYDPKLSSLPLHFLGDFAEYAQENQLPDVAIKASLTLQEVARNILSDPEMMKSSSKEIFISVISHLEAIAKKTFRQDKSTSLALLTQPFQELKKIFTSERYASHPDAGVIVNDLDRILGEFEALDMVLRTVPNIPGYSDENASMDPEIPPVEQKE